MTPPPRPVPRHVTGAGRADGQGGHGGRGRWGLWDAVGSLLGFVAVSFAVSAVLVVLFGVDPVTASLAATVLGWLPLAGWPVVATRRYGAGPRVDLRLEFRVRDLGIGVLAALVVLAGAVVFAALYSQLTGHAPSSAVGDAIGAAHAEWQVVALAAMTVVAPLMEELHFRGLWWGALRRRGLPGWPTLLVTSALFAAAHLEPSRAPFLFLAGLAAGFVRMVTDRLGPAVVAHLVVNSVAALGLVGLLR